MKPCPTSTSKAATSISEGVCTRSREGWQDEEADSDTKGVLIMNWELFSISLMSILAGYLFGVIHERHRLHDFVERERKWGAEQAARADRAVDQLVLQSGGTPISALAQVEQEKRQELHADHQNDLNEIFADETGDDQGPGEPPQ